MNVSIISSEYTQIHDINVLPSKGNLTRNIDINTLPLIKGDSYNEDSFFPSDIVELNDPYILRDYRGQVVQINPFQYNPVSKVLKIYSNHF